MTPAAVAPQLRRSTSSSFRPDIQGLRAVAVTVVILDHLIGRPAGGFVGVDIFFVISGFLITEVLLKEHRRTGSISFNAFYRRRAKRILPAASLVLVLTVAGTYVVYASDRAMQTFWDAVAATFFFANWRFAANGTDYFQAAFPPSPLQHFWSLSVEEQFYFVWPWLMLAIFIVLERRHIAHRGRAVAGIAMAALIVASLLWGLRDSLTQPQIAYFSTFSRAWELGVGALIAICAERLSIVPRRIRLAMVIAGAIGLVVSLVAVTSDSVFPVPSALLPVFSAGLIIAAGVGHQSRLLWPITNRAARYVGDISYSLYLWHWPLIVLSASLLPGPRLIRAGVTSLAIVLCAVLTFHFFENPIRRSTWLTARRAGSSPRPSSSLRLRVGLLGTSAAVLTAVGAALVVQAGLPRPASAPGDATTYARAHDLTDALDRALSDRQWPALDPSTADLSKFLSPALGVDCFNNWDLSNQQRCTSRPRGAKHRAVVLGDSVAMSWVPGVSAALASRQYSTHALGFSNCPVALVEIRLDPSTARCTKEHRAILDAVVGLRPDLIVISDSIHGPELMASGATGTAAVREWSKARAAAIRVLQRSGARVVLLESNPDGTPISECRTNFSAPSACVSGLSSAWRSIRAADEAAAHTTGVQLIDPQSWFCVDGRCPAYAGDTLMRWDTIHLTRQYSSSLSRQIGEALFPRL